MKDHKKYYDEQKQTQRSAKKRIIIGLVGISIFSAFMFGYCEGVHSAKEIHNIKHPNCK